MKKQIMHTAAALTLAGLLTLPALATANPLPGAPAQAACTLDVNGTQLDSQAVIMVPLRAVAEGLGFTVTWSPEGTRVDTGTQYTTVVPGLDRYTLTTSQEGLVGMSAPFSLGIAPCVAGGVTYVPLDLFASLLGSAGSIAVNGTSILLQNGETQIPNPFLDCASLTQAEEAAGFSLALPNQLPNWVEQTHFQAISDQMLQVVWEGGGARLTLRKAVGQRDISGDYTDYPNTSVHTLPDASVTLKGSEDGVFLALWSRDGYSYALSASDGMSKDLVLTLCADIR